MHERDGERKHSSSAIFFREEVPESRIVSLSTSRRPDRSPIARCASRSFTCSSSGMRSGSRGWKREIYNPREESTVLWRMTFGRIATASDSMLRRVHVIHTGEIYT